MRNLVPYGLRGAAAYSEHARALGEEDASVSAKFQRIAVFLATDPTDVDSLIRESLPGAAVRRSCANAKNRGGDLHRRLRTGALSGTPSNYEKTGLLIARST